jgi:PleD family two-component response regulator
VAASEGPLDPRGLLSAAADALYMAKRAGRDRTVVSATNATARV